MTGQTTEDLTIGQHAERVAIAAGVVSALLLEPPTEALAASFADTSAAADWPIDDPDAREALESVARTGVEADDVLRSDHFRLFVGPGRGDACPYESVYVSRDHLLFSPETYDVRAAYARLGLEAPKLDNEPDDHLGLELAFVAELAHRLMHASGDEQRDLRELLGWFLAAHLDRFAPEVMRQVAEHARTSIYRALPALVESVLREARELGIRHLPVDATH